MCANRCCLLFYVIRFNVLNVTADKNCYRHYVLAVLVYNGMVHLNLPILWTFPFVKGVKTSTALLFLGHDQLLSSGFYSVMLVQSIPYCPATRTVVSSVDTSHSNDSLKAMPRQVLREKKNLPYNIHHGPNRLSQYNYH